MDASAQQYLAFIFTESWVSAALWQKSGKRISVLLQPPVTPIVSSQMRDLTQALEESLDELGEAGLTVKNVLLAVPRDWIADNDLNAETKRLLKQLTQDLLLQPLGYVVVADAIVAAEQNALGTSFSGTVLSQSEHHIYATMYEDGVESSHEKIGKSGDWTQDAQELLARIPATGPARERVLLIEHTEKEVHQALEAALQTAQLSPEVITAQHAVQSSITIGGDEVLKASEPASAAAASTVTAAAAMIPTSEQDETDIDGFAPVEFGPTPSTGMLNHALPADDNDTDEQVLNRTPPPEGIKTDAGFVIHGATLEEIEGKHDAENQDDLRDDNLTLPSAGKKRGRLPTLPALPKFTVPNFSGLLKGGVKGKLALGAAVVILAIIAGGAFATQTYSVTITAQLDTQEISKEGVFPISLDKALTAATATNSAQQNTASGAAETAEGSLTGLVLTKEVTLDTEVPTTGTNVTGDPAKGKVTFYNKSSQNKLFPAGTRLTAGTIVFTLDDDVQVASAETSESESSRTTKFGTSEGNITASAIGPAGNIAKDTTLTVANFDRSSYEAKSLDGFGGGTEREIQAVAKKDIDEAAKKLRDEAIDQLKSELEKESNDDTIVLALDGTRVTAITPSAAVGDEAKIVQVTVKVESQGISLKRSDAIEQAQTLLSQEGDTNEQLLPETVVFEPLDVESANTNKVVLRAKIGGQRVPQLQASSLHEQLAGQNISRAITVLQQNSAIKAHTITFQPSWLQWVWPYIPSAADRVQYNLRIDRAL